MLNVLSRFFRNWWMFALRGAFAIMFGILALIWPEPTKLALVVLFGAFALTDGVIAIVTGIASYRSFEYWWALLMEGLTGIFIGLLTILWPNVTALVLMYFIASWAIITGIFEIVAAIRLRRALSGEWAMILAGLLSMLLGILLFIFPKAGAISLIWMIGIYAIAAGISEMNFAFRLRGLLHDIEKAIVAAGA